MSRRTVTLSPVRDPAGIVWGISGLDPGSPTTANRRGSLPAPDDVKSAAVGDAGALDRVSKALGDLFPWGWLKEEQARCADGGLTIAISYDTGGDSLASLPWEIANCGGSQLWTLSPVVRIVGGELMTRMSEGILILAVVAGDATSEAARVIRSDLGASVGGPEEVLTNLSSLQELPSSIDVAVVIAHGSSRGLEIDGVLVDVTEIVSHLRGVPVVILAACGAGRSLPEAGVAQALAQSGAAVIAMWHLAQTSETEWLARDAVAALGRGEGLHRVVERCRHRLQLLAVPGSPGGGGLTYWAPQARDFSIRRASTPARPVRTVVAGGLESRDLQPRPAVMNQIEEAIRSPEIRRVQIVGRPGYGKSTLLRLIDDHDDRVVASVLRDPSLEHPDHHDASVLLGALRAEIARQASGVPSESAGLQELSQDAKRIHQPEPVVVLVDELDAASSEFQKLLSGVSQSLPAWVTVVCATRQRTPPLELPEHHVQLIDLDGMVDNDEIRAAAQTRLSKVMIDDGGLCPLIDEVVAQAEGMFLFVDALAHLVAASDPQPGARDALNLLRLAARQPGSNPLFRLYERWLAECDPGTDTRRILDVLACCQEPSGLPLSLLSAFSGVRDPETEVDSARLAPWLRRELGQVRLFHASFADWWYLRSDGSTARLLSVHLSIAKMLMDTQRNEGVHSPEVEEYAARHLLAHLEAAATPMSPPDIRSAAINAWRLMLHNGPWVERSSRKIGLRAIAASARHLADFTRHGPDSRLAEALSLALESVETKAHATAEALRLSAQLWNVEAFESGQSPDALMTVCLVDPPLQPSGYRRLMTISGSLNSVVSLSEREFVVSLAEDGLLLHDVASGFPRRLEGSWSSGTVTALARVDDDTIAVGTAMGTVQLLGLSHGERIPTLTGVWPPVSGRPSEDVKVLLSAPGGRIVSVTSGGEARICDANDPRSVIPLNESWRERVSMVANVGNGDLLVAVDRWEPDEDHPVVGRLRIVSLLDGTSRFSVPVDQVVQCCGKPSFSDVAMISDLRGMARCRCCSLHHFVVIETADTTAIEFLSTSSSTKRRTSARASRFVRVGDSTCVLDGSRGWLAPSLYVAAAGDRHIDVHRLHDWEYPAILSAVSRHDNDSVLVGVVIPPRKPRHLTAPDRSSHDGPMSSIDLVSLGAGASRDSGFGRVLSAQSIGNGTFQCFMQRGDAVEDVRVRLYRGPSGALALQRRANEAPVADMEVLQLGRDLVVLEDATVVGVARSVAGTSRDRWHLLVSAGAQWCPVMKNLKNCWALDSNLVAVSSHAGSISILGIEGERVTEKATWLGHADRIDRIDEQYVLVSTWVPTYELRVPQFAKGTPSAVTGHLWKSNITFRDLSKPDIAPPDIELPGKVVDVLPVGAGWVLVKSLGGRPSMAWEPGNRTGRAISLVHVDGTVQSIASAKNLTSDETWEDNDFEEVWNSARATPYGVCALLRDELMLISATPSEGNTLADVTAHRMIGRAELGSGPVDYLHVPESDRVVIEVESGGLASLDAREHTDVVLLCHEDSGHLCGSSGRWVVTRSAHGKLSIFDSTRSGRRWDLNVGSRAGAIIYARVHSIDGQDSLVVFTKSRMIVADLHDAGDAS